MDDKTAESFAEHVKDAATQVMTQLPREFPKYADEVKNLAEAVMSVFQTPDFLHGFQRWILVVSMVNQASQCDCSDDEKHEFLRRCDAILTGHTMSWQLELFDNLLSDLPGLDRPTIEKVVSAMADKMTANITQVDKVEVPDYVPSDWDNGKNGD